MRRTRMGAGEDDVRRVFGEPGKGDGFFPLGESFGEIGGAPAVRNWPHDWRGRPTVLRYEGVGFLLGPRGVFAFVVAEEGARTKRGVRIGHSLERAASRSPASAEADDSDAQLSRPSANPREREAVTSSRE